MNVEETVYLLKLATRSVDLCSCRGRQIHKLCHVNGVSVVPSLDGIVISTLSIVVKVGERVGLAN